MREITHITAGLIACIVLTSWPGYEALAQTPTANPAQLRLIDIFLPAPDIKTKEFKTYFEKIRVAIDNGADIDAADKDGNTPLLTAVGWAAFSSYDTGANDFVAFLLSRGANPNKGHKEMKGMTPLHLAAQAWWSNFRLIELLCAAGADAKANVQPLGVSPLEMSQSSKFPRIKRAMESCTPK